MTKLTSFREYNISIANNTSSLEITIYFSADNSSTYFTNETLVCLCEGIEKTQKVSHPIGGSVTAKFYFENIPHNPNGAKNVSWVWYCQTGTQGLGTVMDTDVYDLSNIPRKATISSVANFNDEQNPVLNYSNLAGNSVSTLQACISLTGTNDDIAYRDIVKTSTSYTFNLTSAERNILRNATINSNTRTVKFMIKTIIGGNTYYDSKDVTLSITNANPEMAMFSVEANDTATKTLMDWISTVTSDNGKIIQAKTQVKLNLGAVTLKKGATFKKYIITASGNSYETTSNSYVITGGLSTNGNIIVTAEDSRGNTVNRSFAYNLIAYENPFIANEKADRLNYPNGDKAQLSFNAKIAKLMKDKGQYNIKYKYKKTTESTYSSLITLSPSSIDSEGNITFDKTLSQTFENSSTYDFVVYVNDYFNNENIFKNISLNKEAPELWIGDETVAILGLPPDNYEKNALYFKGKLMAKWTDE